MAAYRQQPFLGPGEVRVRLEDVMQWTFEFDFDKVLFFERQPGGTGTVIELLRAERLQSVSRRSTATRKSRSSAME